MALLDLAVEYGADVATVADEAMAIAERSGVAAPLIAATEQEMGAWFAERAVHAPGPPEDRLAALIDAMREAIGGGHRAGHLRARLAGQLYHRLSVGVAKGILLVLSRSRGVTATITLSRSIRATPDK